MWNEMLPRHTSPSLVAKAFEGTRHSHVGRRRHVRHYAMAGQEKGVINRRASLVLTTKHAQMTRQGESLPPSISLAGLELVQWAGENS